MLAALFNPEALARAVVAEIEREANSPLPIRERAQRLDELDAQVDELERQASDLTHAICAAGGSPGARGLLRKDRTPPAGPAPRQRM